MVMNNGLQPLTKLASDTVLKGLPRPLRLLCLYGEDALKPQVVNGRWKPPLVGPRQASRVRKYAILDGTYGVFDRATGKGWEPSWEKQKKFPHIRAPKGHIRERNREARAQKIDNLMETMDEKVAQYRQARQDRKPIDNFMNRLNKLQKRGKR